MKVVLLVAFIVSIGCCIIAQVPNPAQSSEDEIGERWVGKIKDVIKESFMRLLATSEFITKKELASRIDTAQNALNSFKALVNEEMGSEPASSPLQLAQPVAPQPSPAPVQPVQAPVTPPAQSVSEAPVATPAVAEQPAPQQPVVVPAQTQPAAAPVSAEGLVLPTVEVEPMTQPTQEAAPQDSPAPAAILADNEESFDDEYFHPRAKTFDDLAKVELDESAEELIKLNDDDDDDYVAGPRFNREAMAQEISNKIQVIHDEDVMNTI